MTEERKRRFPKRLGVTFLRVVVVFFRTLSRTVVYLLEKIQKDIFVVWTNVRLFFGVACVCIGILSFQSGRYCDGNTSTQYTCTRPATYYYYPLWAIVLSVLGLVLTILWTLHKTRSR